MGISRDAETFLRAIVPLGGIIKSPIYNQKDSTALSFLKNLMSPPHKRYSFFSLHSVIVERHHRLRLKTSPSRNTQYSRKEKGKKCIKEFGIFANYIQNNKKVFLLGGLIFAFILYNVKTYLK